ncbi:beta-1,3-galactosyltransferase 5-like [Actinia tenebrosa]|uniref:Hexosyltransferase n=1 Tax=Actinia tenebrosa TaxID=6105 RepID=A0A6P8HDG4_ACTTE|nr:beta-1,3-galactosyltransferase 5-like [Actinia tenebrosa]
MLNRRIFRMLTIIMLLFLSICLLWWLTLRPSVDGILLQSLITKNASFPIIKPSITPRLIKTKLFVLVIVSSAPAGVSIERRHVIRNTWGNFDLYNGPRTWKVVFMSGRTGDEEKDKTLFSESKKYGDILICDYKDDYSKITTKLLSSFQWAASVKDLYGFEYLLKTDDDIYISIPRLYQWIDTKGVTMNHVYAGNTYSNYVVREKNHRHYVSKEDLPYDIYPTFCKGSMLLLSGSLIPKIVKLARKVKRIVPDDAYVGLLMNELNVKAVQMKGLVQHSFLSYFLPLLGPCHFQNVIGMGDSLTTQQMFHLHKQMFFKIQDKSSWLCIQRWLKLLFATMFLFILYSLFLKSRFLSMCKAVCKLTKVLRVVPARHWAKKKSNYNN